MKRRAIVIDKPAGFDDRNERQRKGDEDDELFLDAEINDRREVCLTAQEERFRAWQSMKVWVISSGTTPDNLVANIKVVGKVTDTQIKGKHDINKMEEIWARKTGRCTSFVVKAITVLDPKGTKYQFEIYDLQGHLQNGL
ncbi:hypothetical protein C8A03DRAFT_34311, partial [Achaetomium macrosporum]